MTEAQKRKKRLFHRKFARSISKYPACEHLNMALWYLLKKPEENRDAIGEIVYAIVKSRRVYSRLLRKIIERNGV
jgi:hypothetical protein